MSPLADTPVKTLEPQIPSKPLKLKEKQSRLKSVSYLSQLESVLNDVDCIEIGTTNVCNRKCVSCPVGTSDIADKLTASGVSESHFSRILANLSVFKNKAFSLSLHEYNEPLKDKSILDKYRLAGKAFPKAKLTLFTNGDMIHRKKKGFYSLAQFYEVGIRHIRISIYDENSDKSKVFDRLGIEKNAFKANQNRIKNRLEFSYYTEYQGEEVLVRVLFLSTQKLSNRGGIIASDKHVKRQGICSLPRRTLSIDYKGNLKMCCNVHHMEEGADTWMHGSLLHTPISDILMSDSYANMRNKTAMGDYAQLEKCQVCDFYQKSSDRLVGALSNNLGKEQIEKKQAESQRVERESYLASRFLEV